MKHKITVIKKYINSRLTGIKEIINFITGNDMKEKKFKTSVMRCVILPNGHKLICHSNDLFYMKIEDIIMIYTKYEILVIYGIKNTEELIKDLSIK